MSLDGYDIFMICFCAVGILALTSVLTKFSTDSAWREEIVASGHGEFYKDADNTLQWRWKECK